LSVIAAFPMSNTPVPRFPLDRSLYFLPQLLLLAISNRLGTRRFLELFRNVIFPPLLQPKSLACPRLFSSRYALYYEKKGSEFFPHPLTSFLSHPRCSSPFSSPPRPRSLSCLIAHTDSSKSFLSLLLPPVYPALTLHSHPLSCPEDPRPRT